MKRAVRRGLAGGASAFAAAGISFAAGAFAVLAVLLLGVIVYAATNGSTVGPSGPPAAEPTRAAAVPTVSAEEFAATTARVRAMCRMYAPGRTVAPGEATPPSPRPLPTDALCGRATLSARDVIALRDVTLPSP